MSKELEDFVKQHKVKNIYKYLEISKNPKLVEFGWVNGTEINLSDPVIISYHSKTKKASAEEVTWSKNEGSNASSMNDYRKFFSSLTSMTPEDFLNRWGDASYKEYEAYWKSHAPHWEDEQRKFVLSLARLIVDHKRFIMNGRGYKVVAPGINNEKQNSKETISGETRVSSNASS